MGIKLQIKLDKMFNTERLTLAATEIVGCSLWLPLAFCPQIFGRGWGPANDSLSFYECQLNGGYAETISFCNQIHLNFLHKKNRGDRKASLLHPSCP